MTYVIYTITNYYGECELDIEVQSIERSAPICCTSQCGAECEPFQEGDRYCAYCGRPASIIDWYVSATRRPCREEIVLPPGGRFYLLAHNRGTAAVNVSVDLTRARGLKLLGVDQRKAAPGAYVIYEIEHRADQLIGGSIVVRSHDAVRDRERWWEKSGWNEQAFYVAEYIRLLSHRERWIIGSPTVLFPPGVRKQYVRIWNDADKQRIFSSDVPAGYSVMHFGLPLGRGRQPVPVAANGFAELTFRLDSGRGGEPMWNAGPDEVCVPVLRMSSPQPTMGPDVVVAIDFGTQNTGVRVRWRRRLVESKPAGTIDIVGDVDNTPRFPTLMLIDEHGSVVAWGQRAAMLCKQNLVPPNQVVVDNLKTYLRNNKSLVTSSIPGTSNKELLAKYFQRIFQRLDDYFQKADPARPLSREHLKVRYILSRPVLDDGREEKQVRAYEQLLREALKQCRVPEEAIAFIPEPQAALTGIEKRRKDELLNLPAGSRVAVVDSGGGTTDVVIAEVQTLHGEVSLRILGSYSAALVPDETLLKIQERYKNFLSGFDAQVGGNILDAGLAFQLETAADRVLESVDALHLVPNNLLKEVDKNEPDREFLYTCRQMKEHFVFNESIFLNKAPGEEAAGEIVPFPTKARLAGIRLRHDLYDEQVAAPILKPVVERLRAEIMASGVDPDSVCRVYYVGGTNTDAFVRRHFSRAFPSAIHESFDFLGLVPNTSPENMAKNRRIEIVFIK